MTDMVDPLPPLREVIKAHDLAAKKSLGQNFLLDLNLTRRIARVAAPLNDCSIFEVGPGPGGLTRALLMEGAAEVIAVERDDRCLPALEDVSTAFDRRLKVISEDAMRLSLEDIQAQASTDRLKIVSNLPYNIGTQLLINWLTTDAWPPAFQSLTLMFQREVADRIVAKPGSKAYGRLAILAQWRGNVRIAVKVPAAAFTPPPKVDSAVIHYEPGIPLDTELKPVVLGKVTEAAFTQRRKMLRTSLKPLMGDPHPFLEAAGIAPEARAETISVKDFVMLAKGYQDSLT